MAAFGHSESRRDRARDQSGLSLARPSGCVFPRCVKKMELQPNKSPCKCFAGAFYSGSARITICPGTARRGKCRSKSYFISGIRPKKFPNPNPNAPQSHYFPLSNPFFKYRLFAEISELPRHVRRALCLSISGFSVFWAKKVLSCLSPRIPTGAFLYRALRRIP